MNTYNIAPTIFTRPPVPLLLLAVIIAVLILPALACSEERVPPPPRSIVPTRAPTLTAPTPPPSPPLQPPAPRVVSAPTPPPIIISTARFETTAAGRPETAEAPPTDIQARRFRQPGFIGAPTDDIVPFTNIAQDALGENAAVANDLTGVAIFDYDRDGDLDFYITQSRGNPNLLFRNEGGERFSEVGIEAGVSANASNSTGVVACDIDNNGYQDIYLSAQGIIGDGKDYQDALNDDVLREAVSDRLMRNNGDGTFTDITALAFGNDANFRTGTSPACADITATAG